MDLTVRRLLAISNSLLCFVHECTCEKFSACNRSCIFLGYPYGQKGWKVYNLETHKIFVSREIIFHESIFPFQTFVPLALAAPTNSSIMDSPLDFDFNNLYTHLSGLGQNFDSSHSLQLISSSSSLGHLDSKSTHLSHSEPGPLPALINFPNGSLYTDILPHRSLAIRSTSAGPSSAMGSIPLVPSASPSSFRPQGDLI